MSFLRYVYKISFQLPSSFSMGAHRQTITFPFIPNINKDFGRLQMFLAHNVPSWRCHIEAIQYIDNFKTLKEQLTRRLFVEFNKGVFDDAIDNDLPIIWDTKFRTTAGTTTNRLIKNARGDRIRTSTIKLSSKVVDGPQRLRDTLIHELCHAATWLIDSELRAGHGPLWNKWKKFPLDVRYHGETVNNNFPIVNYATIDNLDHWIIGSIDRK